MSVYYNRLYDEVFRVLAKKLLPREMKNKQPSDCLFCLFGFAVIWYASL